MSSYFTAGGQVWRGSPQVQYSDKRPPGWGQQLEQICELSHSTTDIMFPHLFLTFTIRRSGWSSGRAWCWTPPHPPAASTPTAPSSCQTQPTVTLWRYILVFLNSTLNINTCIAENCTPKFMILIIYFEKFFCAQNLWRWKWLHQHYFKLKNLFRSCIYYSRLCSCGPGSGWLKTQEARGHYRFLIPVHNCHHE